MDILTHPLHPLALAFLVCALARSRSRPFSSLSISHGCSLTRSAGRDAGAAAKQEGILDKIIPIWKAKGDITDPDKGRDLILELTKAKTPKGAFYTVIQTVMYDDPSAISEDETQMSEWVSDELTWEDVYFKKPVEYLEAISRGETPRWDSEKGGYVYSNDETSEVSMGGTPAPKSINEVADPQANAEIDEELPF